MEYKLNHYSRNTVHRIKTNVCDLCELIVILVCAFVIFSQIFKHISTPDDVLFCKFLLENVCFKEVTQSIRLSFEYMCNQKMFNLYLYDVKVNERK